MPVDKHFLKTVCVGDTIVYKMLLKDLPVNPDKEWHGKILRIHLNEPRIIDCLYVESLEEGETRMTEIVYLQQIIRKESG